MVKSEEEWKSVKKTGVSFVKKIDTIQFQEFNKQKGKSYQRYTDLLLVRCNCGREFEIKGKVYVRKNCNKCSHCSAQKNQYVGMVKSGLLCLSQFHKTVSGREFIFLSTECQNCHEKKDVKADVFISGECSCSECDEHRRLSIFPKKGIDLSRYYSRLKRSAEIRGLIFELSLEELKSLLLVQDCKCGLSGRNISLEDGSASVDRIDSGVGYILNNIQWIYRPYNFMKNRMSNDQFIELCHAVSICKFPR